MSPAPLVSVSRLGAFLRTGTLGRSLFLLLGGALLLLLLANFSTYVLIQRTSQFNEAAEATWQTRRAARTVLLNLKDAETAQRGYVLTGQSAFLASYEASRSINGDLLRQLDRRQAGDPIGEASAQALTRLARDKFMEMDGVLALTRQGRGPEAVAQIRSGRGKLLMEQLDAEVAMLDSQLGARLNDERADSEGSAIFTVVVNAIAGVLILALAVIVFVLVRRYLTEVQQARADLDRINAGLEDTIRLRTAAVVRANQEVQRFAYIVSHDLRSPLVNVMGYTAELEQAGRTIDLQMSKVETLAPDLVEREALTATREDIPEAIGFIRASTEKMDRLINAILKLSRDGRRTLSPEPIDIGDMARRIADSVRHQLEAADAEFLVGEIAGFDSDRLSIEQIMGNLVDNAVKYLEPSRPGRIEVACRDLTGGWVEVVVADNGRGIAEKDHERIFELFRRSGRQDRPGEGLGLAFVRNSVRRLGGTIELESRLGEGSTFRLKFPKRLVLDEAGDTL